MVYKPERDYTVPSLDVLSLLFDSHETWAKEETVLHAEAALPSNNVNKAQLRTLTKRLSYVFRNQFGIGANGSGNDVVVCMFSGQVMSPAIFYGVIGAGGVFSSASSSFTTSELSRQIVQGDAQLLVLSADCKDIGLKAARECGLQPERVLILESTKGRRELVNATGARLNYFDETRELEWERITDADQLESSLVCLLYSSGTTGPPKGVNLSHTNLVAQSLIAAYVHRDYVDRRKREDPGYTYRFSTIAHLPVAHIAGVIGYFLNPTVMGGPVYWMPKFDFPKFLEYNKTFQISFFFTVPPIYLLIAKSPLVKDHFQSLEGVISGAAPLGPELQSLASKRLGCNVTQTWGLSETTGSFTIMPWDRFDSTGSVSPLMPNMRLRIVDDADHDVKEGEEGELICKGPVVTTGYYKNEQATKEAYTRDGWFKTGDIGVRKNGMFYVVDRKKEMIKYKGIQVAPAELEALLLSHDRILDAAVIGVPASDGSGNELPRAYVVADINKISDQEIKDFVKNNLAQHKQLRGGVCRLEAIPKSPSGKILRRELRELVKAEQGKYKAKL